MKVRFPISTTVLVSHLYEQLSRRFTVVKTARIFDSVFWDLVLGSLTCDCSGDKGTPIMRKRRVTSLKTIANFDIYTVTCLAGITLAVLLPVLHYLRWLLFVWLRISSLLMNAACLAYIPAVILYSMQHTIHHHTRLFPSQSSRYRREKHCQSSTCKQTHKYWLGRYSS